MELFKTSDDGRTAFLIKEDDGETILKSFLVAQKNGKYYRWGFKVDSEDIPEPLLEEQKAIFAKWLSGIPESKAVA